MALIYCPECNGAVSDRAVGCPHCAYPLQAALPIEATGKKWKGLALFAIAVATVGFGMAGGGVRGDVGARLIVLGVMLAIVSRVGSWWQNG